MLRAMYNTQSTASLGLARGALCLAACLMLGACATRLDNAPVVNGGFNGSGGSSSATPGADTSGGIAAAPPAPLPPAPPGFYRVKPGDTLYHIALVNGQNVRDVASWNNITNPNQIEVDQLVRVSPPAGWTPGAAPAVGATAGAAVPPLSSGASNANLPPLYGQASSAPAAAPAPAPAPAPDAAASDSTAGASNLSFRWPARGPILANFDDVRNKGIDIGGTAGTPVLAAADGRVVYAGNGLRGYGNLIIIKHDATFLTAYAHNRALLVKEGEAVTKGQKIAEMGNSDSDRVLLHFEVRRQGKPVDPMKYLPPQ
jgi:lipoprotein NlpD